MEIKRGGISHNFSIMQPEIGQKSGHGWLSVVDIWSVIRQRLWLGMSCLAFCIFEILPLDFIFEILSLDFMTFSESIWGSISACPLQMVGAGSHANQNQTPLLPAWLKLPQKPLLAQNSQGEYLSNLQGGKFQSWLLQNWTPFFLDLFILCTKRFTKVFWCAVQI